MFQWLIYYNCSIVDGDRLLGQHHHPNLVKLIGYCSGGDNRLLVYEFMPKGSLQVQHKLFVVLGGLAPLSWGIRVKGVVGAARGLSFLHDVKSQVITCVGSTRH
jgi:serine/threonine protein kinase